MMPLVTGLTEPPDIHVTMSRHRLVATARMVIDWSRQDIHNEVPCNEAERWAQEKVPLDLGGHP